MASASSVSRGANRRKRWFDSGVDAIAHVLGERPEGYVCPLCLQVCTSLAEVSLEDAPPRSVGGRPVALTCVPCNSGAGHRLEGELRKAEDLLDFMRRRPSPRPLTGEVDFEGIALRMESRWVDGRLELVGLPRQNDPVRTQAQTDALHQHTAGGTRPITSSFEIRYAAPDWRRSHVAWLKTAYIATFARLGYFWALRSALDVVRAQIAEPDVPHLSRFYLFRPNARPGKGMFWIYRPASLESVFVAMGEHAVLLPGLKPYPRIYERIEARKHWPVRDRTLRAVRERWLGGWPGSPELQLDRMPALSRLSRLNAS